MKTADKLLIGFFSVVLLISSASLFLPVVWEQESRRGISGALNMPLWVLMIAGIVVSVVVISAVVIANARRKR